MTYPVTRIPHLPIVARDGITLSAAVFLPDAPGDGPFPAILDCVRAEVTLGEISDALRQVYGEYREAELE